MKATIALSLLLLAGLGGIHAQTASTRIPGTTEVVAAPVMQVPLHKVVNFKTDKAEDWGASMKNTVKAYHQGEDLNADALREARRAANQLKAQRQAAIMRGETPPTSAGVAMRTDTATVGIEQLTNFVGNRQLDGFPLDHDIAISNDGLIMSTSNTRVYVYDTVGFQRDLSNFMSFYSASMEVTDPRVVYNPEWDRFIFLFLSGFSSGNNKVVVCFSQTNDPEGAWNVYPLTGNANVPYFGNVWMDYPQIAMGQSDVYISCNPFTDAGFSKGAHIYQVKMADGFNAAASLTVKGWSTNTGFTLCPVQGWSTHYGEHMWFIASRALASATTTFRLYDVVGNTDDAGAVFTKYDLISDLSYSYAPDVAQSGTTQELDNGSLRVRSSYFENDQIHFAFSGSTSGVAEIYVGKITGLSVPAFASIDGSYIRFDTLEIGVPSVAYGGYQNSVGDNATLLFFNTGGSTRFPGNGCVMIEPDGTVGDPLVLRNGYTYIKQMSTNPERWGDYTDIVPRYNRKNEYWVSGYIGTAGTSHQHGTWISKLKVTSPQSVAVQEPTAQEGTVLYPNPVSTSEQVTVEFAVPRADVYRGEIYDLQGKLVKTVTEKRLVEGRAYITFSTQLLPAGTYLLRINSDGGEAHNEKFVVTK
jgi:hypothetical protein